MPDQRQEWVSLATQEYAILQDKIDRIGDFRFRVKGWVVTLITAFLVSGLASNMPAYALLLGIPVIASFQVLEHYQAIWQSAFGYRLLIIERLLHRNQKWEERVPAIGHTVVAASKKANEGSLLRKIYLRNFLVFYVLMYLLVVVSFVIKLTHDTQAAPLKIESAKPIDVRIDP